MNFRNRFTKLLCGATLALAFAVAPGTWALSPAPAPQSSSMSAMNAQTRPVDINTATEKQLKAIPGIGDVYAKRIIANRPYNSKDQLVRKGILPQRVYDKIKDQVVAHRIGDAIHASQK